MIRKPIVVSALCLAWFLARGFGMRAAYLPYKNREQIERDTRRHRETLNR